MKPANVTLADVQKSLLKFVRESSGFVRPDGLNCKIDPPRIPSQTALMQEIMRYSPRPNDNPLFRGIGDSPFNIIG